MHETYKKWLDDGCPKVFCECACNTEIVITRYHKHDGIPKYTNGHNNVGKQFTEEHKQKISIGNTGKVCSEETKQKIRDNKPDVSGENNPFYGKHHTRESKEMQKIKMSGEKHPMFGKHQSKETIEKRLRNMPDMSGEKAPNFGKHFSEDHKEKIRKGVTGENNGMYGKPPAHTKKSYYESPLQGRIYFRSSWELAYAKYLDENKILWMYEMETFDLGDLTYTPDFFLPQFEKFIEVKGYMRPEAQDKINKFLEQYPWDLEILYKKDLIKLGISV